MASKGGHWKAGRFARAKNGARLGGPSSGGYASALSKLKRGLKDSDIEYFRDPASFRQSSFDAVRSYYRKEMAAGKSPTRIASDGMKGAHLPVRFNIEPSGKIHLNEGRHRMAVARESGARAIRARVVQYGPRGGVKWDREMVIKLR